jgi:hypothetical protein
MSISESSKKVYENAFQKLLNNNFNQNISIDELKEILNCFTVKNKPIKNTTKNNYLKSIVYAHKTNKITISDQLMKDIQELMKSNNLEYTTRQKQGILNESLSNNYLDWGEIINIFNNHIKKDTDIKNIFIVALYVLQPPRRLKDFINMKMVKRRDPRLSKEFNYIVNTNYPVFVYNNYKTAKTYGTQEIFIESQELIQIMKNYIDSYHIKANNLLFPNGEEDFKKCLRETFIKYSQKSISVSILRHSYITYATKHNILDLLQDRENLSLMMGHSINTQLQYYINEKYLKNKIIYT